MCSSSSAPFRSMAKRISSRGSCSSSQSSSRVACGDVQIRHPTNNKFEYFCRKSKLGSRSELPDLCKQVLSSILPQDLQGRVGALTHSLDAVLCYAVKAEDGSWQQQTDPLWDTEALRAQAAFILDLGAD